MTVRSRSARSSAKVEARGEVPPKMLLVSSTTDYYSLRASLGRTGASGTADQPLPANVRMYDIAGGSHVIVPKAPSCTLPPARLDWAPLSRALLLHLDAWVSRQRRAARERVDAARACGRRATRAARPDAAFRRRDPGAEARPGRQRARRRTLARSSRCRPAPMAGRTSRRRSPACWSDRSRRLRRRKRNGNAPATPACRSRSVITAATIT